MSWAAVVTNLVLVIFVAPDPAFGIDDNAGKLLLFVLCEVRACAGCVCVGGVREE